VANGSIPSHLPTSLHELTIATEFDGARVWHAHLDAVPAEEAAELEANLDSTERGAVSRFHFDRDRRRYGIAHGLLRSLLGTITDQPADAIRFEKSARGKPRIVHAPSDYALEFSLSHSAGWAMVAIAWNRRVGVDIEAGERFTTGERELRAIAQRVLSRDEFVAWNSLPNFAARRIAFLRAWTRKEALAKATGRGIADEMNHIEVALDAAAPNGPLSLSSPAADEAGPDQWIIHDLPSPDGCLAALALEQNT
jgi:4'-phosphopantetheinyl transferase